MNYSVIHSIEYGPIYDWVDDFIYPDDKHCIRLYHWTDSFSISEGWYSIWNYLKIKRSNGQKICATRYIISDFSNPKSCGLSKTIKKSFGSFIYGHWIDQFQNIEWLAFHKRAWSDLQ